MNWTESVTGRKGISIFKISMFIEQQFQHATARGDKWHAGTVKYCLFVHFLFYLCTIT